jgi:lysophospholipase L1-like esterase
MQSLPLSALPDLLIGHVDVRSRPDSVQPLRFPAAEAAYYDPFNRWVASCPAGVRLRLITDTHEVKLTVRQRLSPEAPGAERRGAFDLYLDGQMFGRTWGDGGALLNAQTGDLTGDEVNIVHFKGLPVGEKLVELWLPQAATVSISDLALSEGARWRAGPDQRPKILFHGSSITHCMEAEGASAGWPAVAAGLAGFNHQNLGWAGSCLLSGLAARVIRDTQADAIVLKLGINVWPEGQLKVRTFTDSAHAMISIIREKHPTTPIVVISPIYSPGREDAGEGLSLEAMRTVLKQVVETRIKTGDAHIRYLSGLDLFGEADAHMLPDDLHPNTAGYRLMGERFYAKLLTGPTAVVRA